jgi:alkylation response protein AidB-like acyl-CoA dehydrogenase
MDHLGEPDHIAMLRDTLERFGANEVPREAARRWERGEPLPAAVLEKLSALGVFGLGVPEEYGGSGRDVVAAIVTIEELARRSQVLVDHFIMGAFYAGMNLAECGSQQQKAELLPKVVSGELRFAYGLTEPDVGADLASVATVARRDGDAVVVNGAKRFCSGVEIADYIYTLVRTGDPEDRHRNLSLVLIPTSADGVLIEEQQTMGLRGTRAADVTLSGVRVPAANIVGGGDGWNAGWNMLTGPGLDVEKIEVAAMSLGIARAAIDEAWDYAQQRVQFRRPVSANQSMRHALADVKTKLEACRLMTYHAAWLLQTGQPAKIPTSMAKLFVSETACEIVLACQKVMGAYGYVEDFEMERYVRDILAMPILGGSSAIQRNNIANALGLSR